MEKKVKFGAFVSDAGRAAKGLFDRSKDFAIQVMDQNDDGRFDLTDVSAMAETMEDVVKKSTRTIMDSAEERSRQLELKSLRPVFPETLDDADFLMPKFIRVAERDRKHAESEVYKGSIGYLSDQKGFRIVNLFRDSIEVFGLTFCADCDSEFYYVDPSDRDQYIALFEYFSYLKTVRIVELQKIAQDLGAKHFKVTYKEEESFSSEKKVKVQAKIAAAATADDEHASSEKKYSTVKIAAEMDCPGHSPTKPHLKYMQRDPVIQNLITMRMDEKSPLLHHKFMLQLSNSSGIKESDAVKIDAVLKGMKCSGNASIASEAVSETRRYFEYEIDF